MIGREELALLEWHQPLAGLLALLPLLISWLARRRQRRIAAWADPCVRAWAIQPSPTPPGLRLRLVLEAAGWVLLAIALAGPRLPGATSHEDGGRPTRAALHLSVLVQTSHSMHETDIAPSRLERARLALHDLVARHDGESLSLIVWGARAGLLLPATHDAALFADALRWLDADLVPGGTARLDHALALALVQPLPADAARHAVVLITDADAAALAGEELPAMIATLRAQDVTLYALLAAPAATTRTTAFGDGRTDVQGFAELASSLGGTHAALDSAGHGWPQVHDDGLARIALPPAPRATGTRWVSHHSLPLAAAVIALLLAYSPWPQRIRPGTGAALALLLAFMLPAPTRAADGEERAWQAFEQGQWPAAQRLYAQLGGHRGHHGAGIAALNAGRAHDALPHLELAWMLAPDNAHRLDALYNLGHAHAALERWDAALAAWLSVLEARPQDRAAATNVNVARDELQRRRLAAERAQDLYARRGVYAEGHIQPEGAKENELESLSDGSATTAGSITGASGTVADTPPAYTPAPELLDSGRIKIERLVEDPLRLRQGLLEQDRDVRAPGMEPAQ